MFIWDKTGNLDTFFKYKGWLLDFFFAHRKVEAGRTQPDDAIEEFRDALVKSGRQGQPMLLNLGETAPDFKQVYTNPNLLDTSLVFNREEWLKEEVHMAALKDGENYSNVSATGIYFLQSDFSLQ